MQSRQKSADVLDRREFTVEAALALLSGVAITLSACGTSGPDNPTAQTPPSPDPSSTPANNPSPGATPTPSPSGSPTPRPDPTPTPNPTPTPVGDKVGSISSNHGHVARITGGQLTAGGALQLDIRGSAGHTHTVQLSAGEVMAIAGGQQVAKQSSTNSGHSHTVTFN